MSQSGEPSDDESDGSSGTDDHQTEALTHAPRTDEPRLEQPPTAGLAQLSARVASREAVDTVIDTAMRAATKGVESPLGMEPPRSDPTSQNLFNPSAGGPGSALIADAAVPGETFPGGVRAIQPAAGMSAGMSVWQMPVAVQQQGMTTIEPLDKSDDPKRRDRRLEKRCYRQRKSQYFHELVQRVDELEQMNHNLFSLKAELEQMNHQRANWPNREMSGSLDGLVAIASDMVTANQATAMPEQVIVPNQMSGPINPSQATLMKATWHEYVPQNKMRKTQHDVYEEFQVLRKRTQLQPVVPACVNESEALRRMMPLMDCLSQAAASQSRQGPDS